VSSLSCQRICRSIQELCELRDASSPDSAPPQLSSTRQQPLLRPSVPPAAAPSSIKLHQAEFAHSILRCSPVAASRARARRCSPASTRGRRSSRLALNGAHWPAPAANRARAQHLSGSASGAGDWHRLGAAGLASGSYGRYARGRRAGQQSSCGSAMASLGMLARGGRKEGLGRCCWRREFMGDGPFHCRQPKLGNGYLI
jgi:hypothetical protein